MDIDILQVLPMYLCLLFSLCVHEAAHAAMADRCGDPSARLMGRVTLNPLSHIDPIGTVVMPLLMMTTGVPFLFGWAKPVPFNPGNLNNIRRDPVLIAIAGPVSNLLLAIFFVFVVRLIMVVAGTGALAGIAGVGMLVGILSYMIIINLVLLFFNCIPVPPLDGHYVLNYFLPASWQESFQRIGPFGIIIAIMLARPLFRLLNPVFDLVLGVAGVR